MNIRWLLVEMNHLLYFRPKPVLAELRSASAHGKLAQHAVASVEVTMIHQIAGRIDRTRFNLEARPFLAFAPDHGEPFALSHTNDCARTVTVKGAAASGGKFLDVTTIGRAGETEAHDLH